MKPQTLCATYASTMDKIRLELYRPSIGTYELYVPEGYVLEDEESSGILSIASPDGLSSLTISSYSVDGEFDEHVVDSFFNDLTTDYQPVSERLLLDKKDILLEQAFYKDNVNWIWWILAYKHRIIAASVNSEIELPKDLIGVYRFTVLNLRLFDDD